MLLSLDCGQATHLLPASASSAPNTTYYCYENKNKIQHTQLNPGCTHRARHQETASQPTVPQGVLQQLEGVSRATVTDAGWGGQREGPGTLLAWDSWARSETARVSE